MSDAVRIVIEGENLNPDLDGDWTVSLFRNGVLGAQSGLSGSCEDVLTMALHVAIENDQAEDE